MNAKADNGDTARSLALINGNMKIVSLIDNHVMPITSLRAEAGMVVCVCVCCLDCSNQSSSHIMTV